MQNNGSHSQNNQQYNHNTQQGIYPPLNSYLPNDYPQGYYPPQNTSPQNPYLQSQQQGIWNWYKRQNNSAKIGIGGGIICLVLLLYAYFLSTNIGSNDSSITLAITPTAIEIDTVVPTSTQAFTSPQAPTSNSIPTPNPTAILAIQPAQPLAPVLSPTQAAISPPSQIPAQSQATIPQVTQAPIQNQPSTTAPTASPTQPSTTAPTISPTLSPVPTQLSTPDPTTVPTVSSTQPVAQSPTPQPAQPPAPPQTQAPTRTGINGNPWDYDFNPGHLLYSPPANFCTYFHCIKSFWLSTNGYVDECKDGNFSHSGGVAGACSRHGGEMRPLYSH